MNCKNCGYDMGQTDTFCPNCGAPVAQAAQGYAQNNYAPNYNQNYAPNYNPNYAPGYAAPAPAPASAAGWSDTKLMVFGILAAAFASTFYLSFLGIIFGAIALSKAKIFAAIGALHGKAKAGRITGLVGLILGIVMTVFFFIYIIVIAVMIASVY